MFYSKSTSGFYSSEIHGDNKPEDCVEITEEQHAELLEAQSQGMTITANDDGIPYAKGPELPTKEAVFKQASEQVRSALQSEIDLKAASLGFSDGNSLMLYAGFVNPFQTVSLQFAEWEASVWVKANEYKDQVLAAKKPMLSGADSVKIMPIYPV